MCKIIFIILLSLFLYGCSFDKKTGIWTPSKDELKKISELEANSKRPKEKLFKLYEFNKEIESKKLIKFNSIIQNNSWPMSGFNLKNSTGNLEFSGKLNTIIKKKYGKNKSDISNVLSKPIVVSKKILFTDDRGSIFNINVDGSIIWKKNIYKKINKNYYKNLSFSYYKNQYYISDNLGYLYSLDKNTGEIIWKKNYVVPFKSEIKLHNDKIYLVDQDNKISCFSAVEGSLLWSIQTNPTFIKSQNYLALSISDDGFIFIINSSGDLYKINSNNGEIIWSVPTLEGLASQDSDFFTSSDIVINKGKLIFSNLTSKTYIVNSNSGLISKKIDIRSKFKPIIINNSVYILTENGFIVNFDISSGSINWSKNIIKGLKKNRNIKMSGFIIGSEKIYTTTSNGYLITSSAKDGKVESYNKIAKSIYLSPIISNNMIYILTGNSKLIVML